MRLAQTMLRLFLIIFLIFTVTSATAATNKTASRRARKTQSVRRAKRTRRKRRVVRTKKPQPVKTAKAKPPAPPKPISIEQIDQYVKYFSTQGLHRSGSTVDRRAAVWIAEELKRDGLEVTKETFTFRRPISRGAMLSMKVDKINSRLMPGMPLLNARQTGAGGMRGQLGFVGDDGKIPVIHIYVTPSSANAKLRAASLQRFKDAVASGRYKGVIGVTQGGFSGLVPIMIDLSKHYKTPAVLISSDLGNFVEIFAEINNVIYFRTKIRYENSKAYNVIGKWQGTNPKLKPLVVVTSRSAWWTAAAERGTGVAAWLAMAHQVGQYRPRRTVYFVSTTGQEYYSIGLKKFVETHPELVNHAYGWIYIGANVGTKPTPKYLVQGSTRRIRRMVHRALDKNGLEKVHWVDSSKALVQPMARAYDESKHSFIIAATNNRCFRMTCDQWPSAVNLNATYHFAKAMSQVVLQLANTN